MERGATRGLWGEGGMKSIWSVKSVWRCTICGARSLRLLLRSLTFRRRCTISSFRPPDVLPTPRPCFSILPRTYVTSTVSASSATVSLYTRTRCRSVHCTNSMHAESIRRMCRAYNCYETGTTTATRHAFVDTGGIQQMDGPFYCPLWFSRIALAYSAPQIDCRIPESSASMILTLSVRRHTIRIPSKLWMIAQIGRAHV